MNCGRCNIGQKYVCLDGPVFTYAQVTQLLEELWGNQSAARTYGVYRRNGQT